ncbi:MAG: succinate dehydrogenase [Anaerolineae bacterium]|nr:MAG: succinate dehydrogenase [Anaerolineae bacterium]
MTTRSLTPVKSGNFETFSWFFMRVSALLLIFLVVFHLLYMHIVIRVENITFRTIVDRWSGPLGWFWSLYDITMLFLALLHGANGARWVIDDYIRPPAWNTTLKVVLYLFVFIMLIIGIQTILRFQAGVM